VLDDPASTFDEGLRGRSVERLKIQDPSGSGCDALISALSAASCSVERETAFGPDPVVTRSAPTNPMPFPITGFMQTLLGYKRMRRK
jgi:hypothetical protein